MHQMLNHVEVNANTFCCQRLSSSNCRSLESSSSIQLVRTRMPEYIYTPSMHTSISIHTQIESKRSFSFSSLGTRSHPIEEITNGMKRIKKDMRTIVYWKRSTEHDSHLQDHITMFSFDCI